MAYKVDKDLQVYQNLVKQPDRFEEGFGAKTIIGAIFLGFLMVPATIYLTLFIGGGLGGAPQWVTLILFAEVIKRSMKSLRQQEIFILFYMTGIVMGAGGSANGLIWLQYYVRSPAAIAYGVAPEIPSWVAPSRDALEAAGRTFFTHGWLTPILLMFGMMIVNRIDNFGLGYALYRLTVDVEKLPFPLAPAGALGITALAETRETTDRWKWRCFSLGGVLGLGFGAINLGLPAVTGAIFGKPVMIFPLPFLDLTPSAERVFAAVPIAITFDLGYVFTGMVLPFWAVVAQLITFIVTLILNPQLQKYGLLPTWRPGMGVVDAGFSNHLDFYLSFGIGLMIAIFVVSLGPILKPLIVGRAKQVKGEEKDLARQPIWTILTHRNRERGDLSIITALVIYVVSTLLYMLVCLWLMPGDPVTGKGKFPFLFFLGFGFIYQPIISYINAKLTGIVGQSVSIPMIREASFILSGYQGAALWFAPIPLNDYGGSASSFKTLELTGTKLGSVIKTEVFILPVIIITTLLFSELIWRLAPVPSEQYPYTQLIWHQQALNTALVHSSTLEGQSPFLEAIKPDIIAWGGGIGLSLFAGLRFIGVPTYLVYGLVRGIGGGGPGVIFELIGAFMARYYFEKRFGIENFKRYIMVILMGYSAGVGLIGMGSVAIALISKSISTLTY